MTLCLPNLELVNCVQKSMAVVSTKWCISDVPTHSVEFEWTIKNFLSITKGVINSAVFTYEGIQWQLRLRRSSQDISYFPSENVVVGEAWCSLGLCVTSGTSVCATYKFTLVGDLQKMYSLVQDTAQSFSQPKQYSFIRQSIRCSEIRKYICNGELRIKCAIKFFSDQSVFHHDGNFVNIPDCDLKESLATLLRDGDHSDVTLVVAGGREFKAHKNILSARSPVFAKMFKHGMSESISNRVTITDIAPDTMEDLLAYVYTGYAPMFKAKDEPLLPATAALPVQLQRFANIPAGSLEEQIAMSKCNTPTKKRPMPPQYRNSSQLQTQLILPTVVVPGTPQGPYNTKTVTVATFDKQMVAFKHLFSAADKYQIDRLKACCENAMNKAITVDNAADTLLFADMHNAAQLKRSCTAFIASNRSKVLTTPGWSKLAERHDLLLSIFQATV